MNPLSRQWDAFLATQIAVFMCVPFPNTFTPVQLAMRFASEEPPSCRSTKSHAELLKIYSRAKRAKVPFRIFYLRVKALGWKTSHALKTPTTRIRTPALDYRYSLQEVCENAPDIHRKTVLRSRILARWSQP